MNYLIIQTFGQFCLIHKSTDFTLSSINLGKVFDNKIQVIRLDDEGPMELRVISENGRWKHSWIEITSEEW